MKASTPNFSAKRKHIDNKTDRDTSNPKRRHESISSPREADSRSVKLRKEVHEVEETAPTHNKNGQLSGSDGTICVGTNFYVKTESPKPADSFILSCKEDKEERDGLQHQFISDPAPRPFSVEFDRNDEEKGTKLGCNLQLEKGCVCSVPPFEEQARRIGEDLKNNADQENLSERDQTRRNQRRDRKRARKRGKYQFSVSQERKRPSNDAISRTSHTAANIIREHRPRDESRRIEKSARREDFYVDPPESLEQKPPSVIGKPGRKRGSKESQSAPFLSLDESVSQDSAKLQKSPGNRVMEGQNENGDFEPSHLTHTALRRNSEKSRNCLQDSGCKNTAPRRHTETSIDNSVTVEDGEAEPQMARSRLECGLSEVRSTNSQLMRKVTVQAAEKLRDKVQFTEWKLGMQSEAFVSYKSEELDLKQKKAQVEKSRAVELEKVHTRCQKQAEFIRLLEFVNANSSSKLVFVTDEHNEAEDEISRLELLNEALNTEVKTARGAIAMLKANQDFSARKVQVATADAKKLSARNTALKSDLHRVGGQEQTLKVNLQSTTEKHSHAIQRIRELTQENEGLNAEMEGWRQSTAQQRISLGKITMKHDRLVSDLAWLRSHLFDQGSAREKAEGQAASLGLELSKRIEDHKRAMHDAAQLAGRTQFLEKQCYDSKNVENHLRAELSKQSAAYDQVFNDAKQYSHITFVLTKERDEALQRAQGLKSQLANAMTAQKEGEKAVNEAINKHREHSAKVRRESHEASTRASDLQKQLSMLTSKYSHAISRANVLSHNNSLLESNLDALKKLVETHIPGQWEGDDDFERFLQRG